MVRVFFYIYLIEFLHVQLKENGAEEAYAGVAFHCYAGNVSNQDIFHDAYPDKDLFFTECTSVPGSDWWTDIQVSPCTHWHYYDALSCPPSVVL